LIASVNADTAPAANDSTSEASARERDGNPMVRTTGLTKRYGDFTALEDCSIVVRRGEVFGLLGPNGAGKTTLIRSLLGFLHPTSGTASIDNIDPMMDGIAVRSRVAYLPGDAHVPRHWRGEGVLRFFAEIHPAGDLENSRKIAEYLELDTRRHVGTMSTGMRQKLALSVVLGLSTPLIILDEPTANLDPSIRSRILELVLAARKRGQTVMFSSHVLSEIEDTCDRVVFLRSGRLVRELVMKDLFQRHRIIGYRKDMRSDLTVPGEIQDRIEIRNVDHDQPDRIQIDTQGDLSDLLPWLSSLSLSGMRIEPLGLRTIYEEVHGGSSQHRMDRVTT
jgi:ABC-2 type transport system ATP-binding protein